MSLAVILLMAVVTYGPRLAGLLLAGRQVSAFWRRFLHFVPVSVFAALVAPAVPGEGEELTIRLLAAGLAALTLWRWKQLWLGLLVGMITFWLLRAL